MVSEGEWSLPTASGFVPRAGHVAIVGAGIVNLVTAWRLASAGYRTDVYDSGPGPVPAPEWASHGCTMAGDNARMFTLTEADVYHRDIVVPLKGPSLLGIAVSDGGWRAFPEHSWTSFGTTVGQRLPEFLWPFVGAVRVRHYNLQPRGGTSLGVLHQAPTIVVCRQWVDPRRPASLHERRHFETEYQAARTDRSAETSTDSRPNRGHPPCPVRALPYWSHRRRYYGDRFHGRDPRFCKQPCCGTQHVWCAVPLELSR